jgi:hypothetical protein
MFILWSEPGHPKAPFFQSISIERPPEKTFEMGAFGCRGAFYSSLILYVYNTFQHLIFFVFKFLVRTKSNPISKVFQIG